MRIRFVAMIAVLVGCGASRSTEERESAPVVAPSSGVEDGEPSDIVSPPTASASVLELPPVVRLPSSGASPGGAIVLVLGESMPPSEATIERIQSAHDIVGGEAPVFTPARDYELVVGEREPAFEGVLLSCPSARLEAVRALWLRDHLGDDRWHAAVEIRSTAPVGTATPCPGGPRFHAASPWAVLLGAHRVEPCELERPEPGFHRSSRFDGTLTSASIDGRAQLVFRAPDGASELVSDDPSRLTEVASTAHAMVPFALCVDDRAALLEAHCPAGARECTYRLLTFADCTGTGSPL